MRVCELLKLILNREKILSFIFPTYFSSRGIITLPFVLVRENTLICFPVARSYERINWNYMSRDCPMYSCELIYWISCCAHSTAFKFNITAEREVWRFAAAVFSDRLRDRLMKKSHPILFSSCKKKKKRIGQHLCNSFETERIQIQLRHWREAESCTIVNDW